MDHRFDERRGFSLRFRNWRVRTKIITILLIPTLAVIALSGLRLLSVAKDMRQADRAEQIAEFTQKSLALGHELQAERDLTGAFLGTQREFGGDQLKQQRAQVDRALRDYNQLERELNGDYGRVVEDLLAALQKHRSQLPAIREAVDKGVTPWPVVFGDYSGYVNDLIKSAEDIPQGLTDPDLADQVRALSALSHEKSLLASERGYLAHVFGAGDFEDNQMAEFLNLDARLQAAQESFQASTTAEQRSLYERTIPATSRTAVQRLREKATAGPPIGGGEWVKVEDWYNTTSSVIQQTRTLEVTLANQVTSRAHDLHTDAQRQAVVDIGVVVGVLVVTLLLGLAVARSLVRPLRRLRSTATDVAQTRLPEAVRRLRSTDPGELDAQVEAIRIKSTDEVGEVAAAFNSVHREAVRVAVEQALLRRNVSTMFVNLSRRTQSLVERQLRLIDDLEVNEEDKDALGNLFQLDHLATRMRRNAENLLVLAGAESGRRWNHPVTLLDVLRASAAEVEQYPRVAQTYVTNREVDGRAVGDVVHLVAELLENALEFSSPETQVVVSARSLSGGAGVMIEIEDRGIGMSAEELSAANARLAISVEIDVSLSRMMGLYVVGKLASRHGIQVQLRHAQDGGVSAHIHLPSSIVAERSSSRDEMDQFTLAAGEEPVPVGVASPPPSRAELGEHETRPILAEHARQRTWPRARLDEDIEPPQHLGEGLGPDDLLSDTGSHRIDELNGFSGDRANMGTGGGSNNGINAGLNNGINNGALGGYADPPTGRTPMPFEAEEPAAEMSAPEAAWNAEPAMPPQPSTPDPDLGAAPAPVDDTAASPVDFGFGGSIAEALAGTAPEPDLTSPARPATELSSYDGGHTGPVQERSFPDMPRPELPRRIPQREYNQRDSAPQELGQEQVPSPPSLPELSPQDGYAHPPQQDVFVSRGLSQDTASDDPAGYDSTPSADDTAVYDASQLDFARPAGGAEAPQFSQPSQPSYPTQPSQAGDFAAAPGGDRSAGGAMSGAGAATLDGQLPEAAQQQEEFLPIYAQVESEWFRRRPRPGDPKRSQTGAGVGTSGTANAPAAASAQPTEPTGQWESPADDGWRAADQMAKARVSGTTRAGLPVRIPMAHYVPGSAGSGGFGPGPGGARGRDGAGQASASTNGDTAGPTGDNRTAQGPGAARGGTAGGPARPPRARTPDAVRGLLSSYHRGLRQGREAGRQGDADGDQFRNE